jgi:hypothetical protein
MVKFFFSDRGTLDDARRALEELVSHAEALRDAFRANSASYSDGPGPFPERLHIGAVAGRFIYDYASTISDWATWAREHVDEWPDAGSTAASFGQKVQRENARLAGLDRTATAGAPKVGA